MNCLYCDFEKKNSDRCPNCGLSEADAVEQASWKIEAEKIEAIAAKKPASKK